MDRIAIAVPCQCVWAGPLAPASVREALEALPAEAQRAQRAGARLLEFPAELAVVNPEYMGRKFWADAARVLDGEGLGATAHLPLHWVDLAALDRAVWEGSIRSVRLALEATEPLQALMAVVHPTSFVSEALLLHAPAERALGLAMALAERLVEALQTLMREGGAGVEHLALENLEGIPMDLFLQLVEMGGVKACLDLGHAVSNGEDPLEAFRTLSEAGKLAGLHLHDAVPAMSLETSGPAPSFSPSPFPPAIGRAHLPLGEGRLDLGGLITKVNQTRFEGPIVLEVDGGSYPSLAHFLHLVEAR